jgi:NADH-quinone oxidoreductase subunit F
MRNADKMKGHLQILLQNVQHDDQYLLKGARARGAYSALQKALKLTPQEVIEEVKKSQLRGRGGAGFPTGMKWSFVPRDSGKPVYLLANADESEPGTFKDRLLIERDPHLIIEGAMIAAYAIGAEWACIFIRGEYTYPYQRIKAAVDECYAAGLLGKNIFGTSFNLDLVVHRGAGAYVCGEESAQLDAIEGKRGRPRLKPPFPAVSGLYGCPTVINNIETLSNIPWIIQNGGEAYAAIGVEKSSGTKLVSASGHINKSGVYEVELGYKLLDLINNECGGVRADRRLKAVFPGGSSVNVLRADELEGVTLDYEGLRQAGSSLGCAGFVVLDDSCSMPEVALNLAHFYRHESCGQCTPCREGGHWIEKILQRIVDGNGRPDDADLIISICDNIGAHTVCALGDTMVLPLRSIVMKFRDEFR